MFLLYCAQDKHLDFERVLVDLQTWNLEELVIINGGDRNRWQINIHIFYKVLPWTTSVLQSLPALEPHWWFKKVVIWLWIDKVSHFYHELHVLSCFLSPMKNGFIKVSPAYWKENKRQKKSSCCYWQDGSGMWTLRRRQDDFRFSFNSLI